MSGKGFKEVFNLNGGIRAWNGEKAFGPQELHLDLLRGDETPSEITVFAYGMENALGTFYVRMSEKTTDKELRDLCRKLGDIEGRHKKMLFGLYSEIDPSGLDEQAFESRAVSHVMEGGFDIEAFMKENEPHMQTAPDVLNLAMMIEAQALDLYLRYAEKSTDERAKDVLFKLGDEEKAHLAALGDLIDQKVQG